MLLERPCSLCTFSGIRPSDATFIHFVYTSALIQVSAGYSGPPVGAATNGAGTKTTRAGTGTATAKGQASCRDREAAITVPGGATHRSEVATTGHVAMRHWLAECCMRDGQQHWLADC